MATVAYVAIDFKEKRQMKKIIIIMLAILFLLSGCIPKENTPEQNESYVEFWHGVVEPDSKIGRLSYTGESVHFTYQFSNSDAPAELGIIMFLDGQIQPYSVDGSDAQEMHAFEFSGRITKNYEFEFTPITGEKGDELFLYIIGIYDVNSNPETTIAPPFLHAVSQSFPFEIVMEEASTYTSTTQSSEVQVMTIDAEDNSSGGDIFRLVHEVGSDDLKLELQALSGEYRIHVFTNHSPILNFDVATDEKHMQVIDLNLPDIEDNGFVYAIAVPTHDHERMTPTPVLKTETSVW